MLHRLVLICDHVVYIGCDVLNHPQDMTFVLPIRPILYFNIDLSQKKAIHTPPENLVYLNETNRLLSYELIMQKLMERYQSRTLNFMIGGKLE